MLVPRRIVEEVLVVRGLLDHGRAQGVALLPRLREGRVLVDEPGNASRFTVLVGPRDGVEEDGEGDGADGEVECGLDINSG
jgi:hypothetical protein